MVGRQDDPPEDVKSAGVSQFEGARLRIGFMRDYFFTHAGVASDLQLRLITNALMRFRNSANVTDNQSRRVYMEIIKKNKKKTWQKFLLLLTIYPNFRKSSLKKLEGKADCGLLLKTVMAAFSGR